MKYLLVGRGKMGQLIRNTATAAGDTIVSAFGRSDLDRLHRPMEPVDVILDFSRPETLPEIVRFVRRTGTPLLSGTTGYTDTQMQELRSLGDCAPVLWSANYSLGMAVLYRVLREASGVLKPDFDVELVETHHNQKEDAPSGSAKLLLEAIDPRHEQTLNYGREGNVGRRPKGEIGVHSLRGGTVAGIHTVHFFGPDEELCFTHRAGSRQIFVNGALYMARLLPGRPNGVYDLQRILFGE